MLAERDAHRACAELGRGDDVARKRRPAANDLVSVVEHRLAQAVDDTVGARPDCNLLEADAVAFGERDAQRVRAAVGIAVQLVCLALERLERRRKRPVRSFVRRELDHAVEAKLALHLLDRLARLVRDELGDRTAEKSRSAHTGGSSSSELFFRQKTIPPPTAASPATSAALLSRLFLRTAGGAAAFAFCAATRLPTCQTAQPSIALRLF